MEHKNPSLILKSISINYAVLMTLAFFSRFRLDKPNDQTEVIQVYQWGFYMQKY